MKMKTGKNNHYYENVDDGDNDIALDSIRLIFAAHEIISFCLFFRVVVVVVGRCLFILVDVMTTITGKSLSSTINCHVRENVSIKCVILSFSSTHRYFYLNRSIIEPLYFYIDLMFDFNDKFMDTLLGIGD